MEISFQESKLNTELSSARAAIYTVSELTRDIKSLLEGQFAQVWVTGEISNFRPHSSGHYYFTLKDKNAQISAVMFRGANRLLKFKLEDGLQVTAQGRLSVYEVRGNYQIILEQLEPKGVGALQLAFEQLKTRLHEEGLFEIDRKRPLPLRPQCIGIVTSPTGAVIRDMIHVMHRRDPNVNILLYPVSVQGESAAQEIAQGIEALNQQGDAELIIIGRGGGSLEDLWAFNSEVVARAVFASKLPVISAVGHETDVTISDFVADLRAPTPSAAAEQSVPELSELIFTIEEHRRRLFQIIKQQIDEKKASLHFWLSHLKHPKKRLEEMQIRLDDLSTRLLTNMQRLVRERRLHLQYQSEKLEVLSPLSILNRGYSIVKKIDSENKTESLLKSAEQAKPGDLLKIKLNEGLLKAQVLKSIDET